MNFGQEYYVTPDTIGNWEGAEDIAAAQVNRICDAVSQYLPSTLNPQVAQNIFNRIMDDWSQDLRLLDATDEEIRAYARALLRTAA